MRKYITILCIGLLLAGCGSSEPAEVEPAEVVEIEPTSTPFPTLPPEEQAQAVAEALEPIYDDAFGKDYSLIAKDDTVVLSVWNDRFTASGLELIEFDGWDDVRSSAVSMCEDILQTAENLDCGMTHATVNCCDGKHLDRKLLIVEDGIVVYDIEEEMR